MNILSEKELEEKILDLPSWSIVNQALEKTFNFKNFGEALSFIVRIGIESEKMNHHPEIHNVYNKVSIRLNTHEVQGLTNLDFILAKKIESAYHP